MGDAFDFDENLFAAVQEMVAEFYGVKTCPSINEARYRKFCTKNKVPEPHKLPPTKDELLLHCQRANYVTCIWKSALSANDMSPTPEGRHAGDQLDESKASTRHLTRILIMWLQEVRMPEQHVYMYRKWTEMH